jgi:ParB family chromosome partitioning protein
MMPFDASEDPEQALQVEISENEKRRDYTPNEVRALASRLRAAGYVDTPGRPSKDEKRLRPALEVIVGKSLRSVRRYLTEEKPVQVGVGQVSKKIALRHALKALEQWISLPDSEKNTPAEKQLTKKLPQLLELIEKALALK